MHFLGVAVQLVCYKTQLVQVNLLSEFVITTNCKSKNIGNWLSLLMTYLAKIMHIIYSLFNISSNKNISHFFEGIFE